MTGLVAGYLQHFTYLGLFLALVLCGLGLPMPEDAVLLAGGFLVHRGIIQYPITVLISLFGVVAGDNLLFFMGRRFGSSIVGYFEIVRPRTRQRIGRLKEMMSRHGHMAIFYARFLAGIRALVYLTAGSFGVKPARFLVYDALGALISVPLMVSIGYLFSSQIELALGYVSSLDRMILIGAAACIIFYASHLMLSTTDGGGPA